MVNWEAMEVSVEDTGNVRAKQALNQILMDLQNIEWDDLDIAVDQIAVSVRALTQNMIYIVEAIDGIFELLMKIDAELERARGESR